MIFQVLLPFRNNTNKKTDSRRFRNVIRNLLTKYLEYKLRGSSSKYTYLYQNFLTKINKADAYLESLIRPKIYLSVNSTCQIIRTNSHLILHISLSNRGQAERGKKGKES